LIGRIQHSCSSSKNSSFSPTETNLDTKKEKFIQSVFENELETEMLATNLEEENVN
jgi:hypothetical protein